MSRRDFFIVIGCIASLMTSCHTKRVGRLDTSYHAAVVDAALIQEEEIVDTLLSASRGNNQLIWNEEGTKLLIVTWKAAEAYEKFIKPYTTTSKNEEYVVWVTLAPQVQRFCNAYTAKASISKEDLELRLKQYLGLNHSWHYDVFVELWVSPEALFRPCVDPEIHDTGCDLHFGEQLPVVKNIRDYREFYKNLYYKSFRSRVSVPWTGLGYTYDWGSRESEVGASEFILIPGATYEIKQVVPTMEYCTQNPGGAPH